MSTRRRSSASPARSASGAAAAAPKESAAAAAAPKAAKAAKAGDEHHTKSGANMRLVCWAFIAGVAGLVAFDLQRSNAFDVLQHLQAADLAAWFWSRTPSWHHWLIYPVYCAFLRLLEAVVPGSYHTAVKNREGKQLVYKINGLRSFMVLLATLAALTFYDVVDAAYLYDNFMPVLLTVNGYALLVNTLLAFKGRAEGDSSGSFVDDWVMGTQLTPMVLGTNLKFFWLKPAMMGWIVLNLSFVAKQYAQLQLVTPQMVLYQLFAFIYAFDYFWFEDAMTSTWDIIQENFGAMLVWGDAVWITFFFNLQAWALVGDTSRISVLEMAGMVLFFALSFAIFRGSNLQKHQFKHHPERYIWGAPPKVLRAADAPDLTPAEADKLKNARLLYSGWWGLARHSNYLGDVMLGIAYSLPCRFRLFWPWGYPVYLAVLLLHREWRDEARCAENYGKLWKVYCKKVPYRIIPGLY